MDPKNGNGNGSWKNWLLGATSVGLGLVVVALVHQVVVNTERLTRLEEKMSQMQTLIGHIFHLPVPPPAIPKDGGWWSESPPPPP